MYWLCREYEYTSTLYIYNTYSLSVTISAGTEEPSIQCLAGHVTWLRQWGSRGIPFCLDGTCQALCRYVKKPPPQKEAPGKSLWKLLNSRMLQRPFISVWDAITVLENGSEKQNTG